MKRAFLAWFPAGGRFLLLHRVLPIHVGRCNRNGGCLIVCSGTSRCLLCCSRTRNSASSKVSSGGRLRFTATAVVISFARDTCSSAEHFARFCRLRFSGSGVLVTTIVTATHLLFRGITYFVMHQRLVDRLLLIARTNRKNTLATSSRPWGKYLFCSGSPTTVNLPTALETQCIQQFACLELLPVA